MRNWSPFQCEPEVLTELSAWFSRIRRTRDLRVSWQSIDHVAMLAQCPSLSVRLREAGRQVVYGATITKLEAEKKFIHVDHMPGVQARLLFPLLNTEGSYTAFYACAKAPIESPFQDSYKAYVLDEQDCVELERVHMIEPIVLRITTPHAIICNPKKLPRVTLTLRLDKDPVDLL